MSQVKEITRKIKPRKVTFTCVIHPGGETTITEMRLPGPLPHICTGCKESGRYREYRHKRRAKLARAARERQHAPDNENPS